MKILHKPIGTVARSLIRCMSHRSSVIQKNKICLVQGSSRGLGLEFVKQLLHNGNQVIATCRNPSAALELQALRHDTDRLTSATSRSLTIIQLDTTDQHSIDAANESISGRFSHLDILLNVSGVLHTDSMMPETSYTKLSMQNMAYSFATNAIGPTLVSKAFAPLLAKSPNSSPQTPSLIVNLSARVGSISDNNLGGWYSYRASKAALNQLTKTMSLELKRKKTNTAAILMHPGTCDTDLSKPFQRNVVPEKLFSRERGVSQMLEVISKVSMEDTGRYYAWDGSEIEW